MCKIALAINAFGWLQTSGPCTVLYDTGVTAIAAVGDPVGVDASTAGAVSGLGDGTVDTVTIVGTAMGPLESDGQQTVIFLMLE